MSKTLLYNAFGINSKYDYLKTDYEKGNVIFVIKKPIYNCQCSSCSSDRVKHRGSVTRVIRTLPIGKRSTFIKVILNRLECKNCGIIRQEKIDFAEPNKSYTRLFERYVLELSRAMTILDVASLLGVSWHVIKDIQQRYLGKKYSKPPVNGLRHIAIDEISIRKGHRYLTVVMDLDSGIIVYVGDGKGSDSLIPFWKRIRRFKKNIEAVAIDMSVSYVSAVQNNLPDAKLIIDHFHVIKLFQDKLSSLRTSLQSALKGTCEYDILKGTRWLLLKNPQNLNEKKNEKQKLEEALLINKPLATAYYMKEDLRQLWSQENKEKAIEFLKDWLKRAKASGIQMLIKFANTLAAYRTGILAYYDHKISTGPLEGTNNKIKVLKRNAYGFRDMGFFKLKIYALHEAKFRLVG